jgi:hypothetical protein
LRLGGEAIIVRPDGRGTPDNSFDGRTRRGLAETADDQERFGQEASLVMLFRHIPQGYSPLGSEPARRASGKSPA